MDDGVPVPVTGSAVVPPKSPGERSAIGRDPHPAPEAPVPVQESAPEPAPRFRLGNRPPLTGIRAFGVGLVLVYHSNFKTLPGSWVAIQMFFVLSGFLITSMLAGEGARNGRISIKNFYARRGLRLVPPLLLTIGLLAIYASLVSVADASQRLWGDASAALFYYADYRQAFGHAPFFGFLAQTWSLSIEEQFYVIWSVLMVVAIASHRRRLAYVFAVVGIALSAGDRLWIIFRAPHFGTVAFYRVYYAFDSRADALFIGCLLGLLAADGYLQGWKPWPTRVLKLAAAISAAVMVWGMFGSHLFTESVALWWMPASTVAFTIIITYLVISPRSLGSRFVGLGIFVFVGDLSYTLYLVHFPVYLALQPNGTHWSYWPTELLRLAIIFAIAIGSWFLIEKPLTGLRRRSNPALSPP
jgi:peptidoglycan/LPS O-acetylase OafA/YrhL